jgi:hypothetical protein
MSLLRSHTLIVLGLFFIGGPAFVVHAAPKRTQPAPAEKTQGPQVEKSAASGLPAGVSLTAISIRQDAKDGSIVAEGEVTIESGGGRIQADRITFRERHIVEAEGNVLIVWDGNRISGTHMVYDMGVKDDPDPEKRIAHGVIDNAIGQVDPEFFFNARKVETIGDDHVILYHAEGRPARSRSPTGRSTSRRRRSRSTATPTCSTSAPPSARCRFFICRTSSGRSNATGRPGCSSRSSARRRRAAASSRFPSSSRSATART